MKMGVENGIFWSEIGSGFGELGGTPLPRIPWSTPPPPPPPRRLELSLHGTTLIAVDGWILVTHIWHPPQIFLQGRMTSQRRESLGSR